MTKGTSLSSSLSLSTFGASVFNALAVSLGKKDYSNNICQGNKDTSTVIITALNPPVPSPIMFTKLW